jgi:hypothetical protein
MLERTRLRLRATRCQFSAARARIPLARSLIAWFQVYDLALVFTVASSSSSTSPSSAACRGEGTFFWLRDR